jgi:hypothetical protein
MKIPQLLLIGILLICFLFISILACDDDEEGDDWDDDDDDQDEKDWNWEDDDDDETDDDETDDENEDDDDDFSDEAYEACIQFYSDCFGISEEQAEQYCSVMQNLGDECVERVYGDYIYCMVENVDCQDIASSAGAIEDCSEELVDALEEC